MPGRAPAVDRGIADCTAAAPRCAAAPPRRSGTQRPGAAATTASRCSRLAQAAGCGPAIDRAPAWQLCLPAGTRRSVAHGPGRPVPPAARPIPTVPPVRGPRPGQVLTGPRQPLPSSTTTPGTTVRATPAAPSIVPRPADHVRGLRLRRDRVARSRRTAAEIAGPGSRRGQSSARGAAGAEAGSAAAPRSGSQSLAAPSAESRFCRSAAFAAAGRADASSGQSHAGQTDLSGAGPSGPGTPMQGRGPMRPGWAYGSRRSAASGDASGDASDFAHSWWFGRTGRSAADAGPAAAASGRL